MKTMLQVFLLCGLALPCAATTLPGSCGNAADKAEVKTMAGHTTPVAAIPGKAMLVFVQRNPHCLGCSVVRVGVDGQWVGADKGNSYFSVAVDPGDRHVCVWWEAPLARMESRLKLTDLETAPGQTYYYEIVVWPNDRSAAPTMHLKPISADEGAFLSGRSRLATLTPKQP